MLQRRSDLCLPVCLGLALRDNYEIIPANGREYQFWYHTIPHNANIVLTYANHNRNIHHSIHPSRAANNLVTIPSFVPFGLTLGSIKIKTGGHYEGITCDEDGDHGVVKNTKIGPKISAERSYDEPPTMRGNAGHLPYRLRGLMLN
eukprot:scaffold9427_cov175-Amphora_coffeaeformis.AAC.8